MNKIFYTASVILILFLSASGLSAQIRKIPAEVTESFSEKYPGAGSVEWKDRLVGFTAAFNLDNINYLANFSNQGEWESTEHEIDQNEVPEAVMDGFDKSKYTDWDILKVDLIELPGDNVQYRIEIGKGDIRKRNLYFNSKGRLVKDKLTL
jgi:hypothetical protein